MQVSLLKFYQDTWTFDGSNWARIGFNPNPSNRYAQGILV